MSPTYSTANSSTGSLTHERGQGSNLNLHGCQLDLFPLSRKRNSVKVLISSSIFRCVILKFPGFHCVYPTCCLLSFLDLYVIFSPVLEKSLTSITLNMILSILSVFSFCITLSGGFILSWNFQELHFFSFNMFLCGFYIG